MANQKIIVDGQEITIKQVDDSEYLSITDIARKFNEIPSRPISNWLKNANTLEFMELWERLNNPNFKLPQMGEFRLDAQSNSFYPSPKNYIDRTDAIGIQSRSGRYGGTYAHIDIAFEFASWISP